jgi:hypothetical protein
MMWGDYLLVVLLFILFIELIIYVVRTTKRRPIKMLDYKKCGSKKSVPELPKGKDIQCTYCKEWFPINEYVKHDCPNFRLYGREKPAVINNEEQQYLDRLCIYVLYMATFREKLRDHTQTEGEEPAPENATGEVCKQCGGQIQRVSHDIYPDSPMQDQCSKCGRIIKEPAPEPTSDSVKTTCRICASEGLLGDTYQVLTKDNKSCIKCIRCGEEFPIKFLGIKMTGAKTQTSQDISREGIEKELLDKVQQFIEEIPHQSRDWFLRAFKQFREKECKEKLGGTR